LTTTTKGRPARQLPALLLGLTLASMLAGCATDERFLVEATEEDRRAGDELARRMIDNLGGAEAFARLHTIRWTFALRVLGVDVISRRHVWDPQRGLAWVQLDEDGPTEVWLRLADKTGVVKKGGALVEGEAARALLHEAHKAWTNDAYWLAAPFKVFDPGAIRERVPGGVRIRFEQVGLTPGDRYLYELDDQGRVTGWRYALQNGTSRAHAWSDPVAVEGVTFFRDKDQIAFDDLSASTEPADDVFAPLLAR
jgi:hypothetical protein